MRHSHVSTSMDYYGSACEKTEHHAYALVALTAASSLSSSFKTSMRSPAADGRTHSGESFWCRFRGGRFRDHRQLNLRM